MADLTAALIETGMPSTAAGVMACLFTSETGSRTAAELARHLQVSAATISHAVGLLHQHGLIRRGRDSQSRRHRYFLDRGHRTRAHPDIPLNDHAMNAAKRCQARPRQSIRSCCGPRVRSSRQFGMAVTRLSWVNHPSVPDSRPVSWSCVFE